MTYEVELKFPLEDRERIVLALDDAGARCGADLDQCDRYFAHPSRDFAETNEALRIRLSGQQTKLTYKGPLLDKATKTRREIELSLADGAKTAEDMAAMLVALGFREVHTVKKTRTPYHLQWQDWKMEVTLDQVEGLGSFLEIETLSEEESREAAQAAILDLARHWDLKKPEMRSYLTMLLQRRNS